jgi:hypothetical protein
LHRQAGQNIVEFGLGIAAVAFVALVGFNALGRAQALYWGATEPTLAQPTPGPGAFIHPTSVDAPVCTDNGTLITGPVLAGDTIVCQPPRVNDIYSDPLKRTPPWGYIGLHLDDGTSPVAASAVCALSHATAGSSNTCSSSLSWTIPTSMAGQTHALSLWYECPAGAPSPCPYAPQSNHAPSQSAALRINIVAFLFSPLPTCVNHLDGSSNVEIGHPITCTAHLVGASVSGQTLTWSAPTGAGTGTPELSCYTGGASSGAIIGQAVWNSPATPGCKPAAAIQCVTDSSGTCSIVYRRLRDPTGNMLRGPVGSQGISVSAPGNVTASASVTVVNPEDLHPSTLLISCADPSADNTNFSFGNANFLETTTIEKGSNLSCKATVIDADPSPVHSCDAVSPWSCTESPDVMDAHSPLGTVTWTGDGVSTQCTLARLDTVTGQAPNQTPFASVCSVVFNAVSNGTVTATLNSPTHQSSPSTLDVH